jgi:hypothetical protein
VVPAVLTQMALKKYWAYDLTGDKTTETGVLAV